MEAEWCHSAERVSVSTDRRRREDGMGWRGCLHTGNSHQGKQATQRCRPRAKAAPGCREKTGVKCHSPQSDNSMPADLPAVPHSYSNLESQAVRSRPAEHDPSPLVHAWPVVKPCSRPAGEALAEGKRQTAGRLRQQCGCAHARCWR